MATNTWVAIDNKTVSASTATVTFTGVSQNYTHLVLEFTGTMTSSARIDIRVGNGSLDTGSNYSNSEIVASTSSINSYVYNSTSTMQGIFDAIGTGTSLITGEVFFKNYKNTNVFKNVLANFGSVSNGTGKSVGTWRSKSAIDTISLIPTSNFATGTFTLYGIVTEESTPAPKATGGAIYSDSLYYYHAFGATGTFTPSQSLTADILVIAGGGGGGNSASQGGGGGGGAGGLLEFSSQSLTATGYTCTVGGGGAGGTLRGANGGDSQFGALTLVKGGGGGGGDNGALPANGGGSGGGGAPNGQAGATGTAGQGNTGGNGVITSTPAYAYAAGGGGGAGAIGGNGSIVSGGNGGSGGIGATSSLINSIGSAVGVAQLSSGSYYIAAGGGGGSGRQNGGNILTAGIGGIGGGGNGGSFIAITPYKGRVNTGGGGGGGGYNAGTASDGAAGGSGVIVVRYLKA